MSKGLREDLPLLKHGCDWYCPPYTALVRTWTKATLVVLTSSAKLCCNHAVTLKKLRDCVERGSW